MGGSVAYKMFILILLLGTLATLSEAQRDRGEFPEIISSIQLGTPDAYRLRPSSANPGMPDSTCIQTVQKALAFQQSALMFEPYAFWNSSLSEEEIGNNTICSEATKTDMEVLQNGMSACFRAAVNAGMDIAVTPNLNSVSWSNKLSFDPLKKYGKWSYVEFFINPLVDALAEAVTPSTRVLFNLQGQIGAAVFEYPERFEILLSQVKDRFMTIVASKSKLGIQRDYIMVGISFNFNKICGCFETGIVLPGQYLNTFLTAAPTLLPGKGYNKSAISSLFNAVDQISVGNRPSLNSSFDTGDLEDGVDNFEKELQQFGVNLTYLQKNLTKSLYWLEYGIGGAYQSGLKIENASEAAKYPYFPVNDTVYYPDEDPFHLKDLSQPSPVRDFQIYYYDRTIEYARQSATFRNQTRNSTFKYTVSGIFLWNQRSWDVQGLDPGENTTYGSFLNPIISSRISDYNMWTFQQNRAIMGIQL